MRSSIKSFEDLGEITEEMQNQGDEIPNVFDNPELFMVVIYLEVANYVIGQCKFVDDNWNDIFTLNEKNINIITKQLEELKDEAK